MVVRGRCCSWLIVYLLTASMIQAQAPFVLQDGTPVRLRINRNLSSADATVGESVDFEVLDEVQVDGVVVIQRGATAIGTVTEAQAKRRMARGGKLGVNIDFVRLVNGDKAALRGVKDLKGGGHTGAMTGGMVATAIVFFPAAPFFLFMKGKDITIPKGHEITVYINGDLRLDRPRFTSVLGGSPSSPAPAVQAVTTPAATESAPEKPMTNADVLALKKVGLGDDVIMSKIRTAKCQFSVDTDELIALKQAGVSDAVIAAMIDATRK